MTKRIEPEVERDMAEAYLAGASAEEAGRRFGHSESGCLRALHRLGIAVRAVGSNRRAYHFDEGYFAQIDTEEKASWLGLLTADGCLADGSRTGRARYDIRLQLKEEDRAHVEAFATALGHQGPVLRVWQPDRECKGKRVAGGWHAQFTVHSKRMTTDLLRAGLTPRKSLTATPWDGPEGLLGAYFGGLIDGDGWIRQDTRRPTTEWEIGCCGSEATMEGLSRYVKRRTEHHNHPRPHGKIWVVTYSGTVLPQQVAALFYDGQRSQLARKGMLARELLKTTFLPDPWMWIETGHLGPLYERHGNWAGVARELGMHPAMLFKVRRRLGMPVQRQPTRRRWGHLANDDLLRMHAEHGEWKAVATALGMSPSKLSLLLKRRGIPTKRRPLP